MRKIIAFLFLLGLMAACRKAPPPSSGMASWDEVRALADAFVLRGKSDAVLAHSHWAGVPPKVAENLRTALRDWDGVSDDLRHTDTQVMTFAEYEALQREDKKDLPEDMRNALLAGIKWNVKPEKVIVFTFRSKDLSDTNTIFRWSAGVIQTNGLWFFAASYTE